MSNTINLYDPKRIEKIASVQPRLCSFASEGDEITLGLKGDPAFPYEYRNSRPIGTINNVEKKNDSMIVHATLQNGENVMLSSNTMSAYDTWEFTEKGLKNVLKRQQNDKDEKYQWPAES